MYFFCDQYEYVHFRFDYLKRLFSTVMKKSTYQQSVKFGCRNCSTYSLNYILLQTWCIFEKVKRALWLINTSLIYPISKMLMRSVATFYLCWYFIMKLLRGINLIRDPRYLHVSMYTSRFRFYGTFHVIPNAKPICRQQRAAMTDTIEKLYERFMRAIIRSRE